MSTYQRRKCNLFNFKSLYSHLIRKAATGLWLNSTIVISGNVHYNIEQLTKGIASMVADFDSDDEMDLDEFANLWGKRAEGLRLPAFDATRPISHAEVEYILRHAPFLQILNTEATFDKFDQVKFITAKSGWVIHDLDDAVSSSPGPFLFGGADNLPLSGDEEGGEGEGIPSLNPGKGTIINQAFDTAQAMIELVAARWPGIEIIAGSELMQWAAWVISEEKKLKLIGFEPTEEHKDRRDRLRRFEKSRPHAHKPKHN